MAPQVCLFLLRRVSTYSVYFFSHKFNFLSTFLSLAQKVEDVLWTKRYNVHQKRPHFPFCGVVQQKTADFRVVAFRLLLNVSAMSIAKFHTNVAVMHVSYVACT